jgi:hypothetical protein
MIKLLDSLVAMGATASQLKAILSKESLPPQTSQTLNWVTISTMVGTTNIVGITLAILPSTTSFNYEFPNQDAIRFLKVAHVQLGEQLETLAFEIKVAGVNGFTVFLNHT